MNPIEFLNKSVFFGFCLSGSLVFLLKVCFVGIDMKAYLQSNIGFSVVFFSLFLSLFLLVVGGISLFFGSRGEKLAANLFYVFMFFFWRWAMGHDHGLVGFSHEKFVLNKTRETYGWEVYSRE